MSSRSLAAALQIPGVFSGSALLAASSPSSSFSPSERLSLSGVRGEVVELVVDSESAGMSTVVSWLVDAQLEGAPVAWVTNRVSLPHPHDLRSAGIDAGGFAFLRLATATDAYQATSLLLQSGGFGVILLHLEITTSPRLSVCQKFASEARASNTLLITLCDPAYPLPDLRIHHSLRYQGYDQFESQIACLKDRHNAPTWDHCETCYGLSGLR